MKACVAVVLLLFSGFCLSQQAPSGNPPSPAAYPESEAAAAWRALAASYIRKAQKDQMLDNDVALNKRVDTVMARVGTAAAAIDSRFANASWKAILIERFGHGAAAFPGETILVDTNFVRTLQLNDDELALMLSHEVAHVVAGHASAKLSFVAKILGKDRVPTARTALVEFLAKDTYAADYLPTARMQEREADTLGAAIFFATGYDSQRALQLFDKLKATETKLDDASDAHETATARKQTIAEVIAELQQLHAGRDPAPR